jgi:putative redox protein
MITSKVKYLGQLRTECLHLKSGQIFLTDGPIDNHGKGEAFSPTDTVATALASCMISIMGIKANLNEWNIDGTSAKVTKIMAEHPRRISEIHVHLIIPGVLNQKKAQTLLKQSALNCPVAKSLSENIIQEISFEFV